MKPKLVAKCLGFAAFLAAILFGAAGRLDWIAGWAFIATVVSVATASAVAIDARHPDLIAERASFHSNTKAWDKVLAPFMALIGPLAIWIVSGLDKRFGWSPPVLLEVHVLGFLGILIGSGIILWAMVTNRFFSSTVRIQNERGHTVVSRGPYRYVRHPGYAGTIAYYLGTPVALGSWYALVPASITVVVTVLRTWLEDKTLQAELPGYRDYAARIRYRLLPGLW